MGVYSELRGFALAHRVCGELRGDAGAAYARGLPPLGQLLLWGAARAVGHAGGCGGGSPAPGVAGVRELRDIPGVLRMAGAASCRCWGQRSRPATS